MEIIKKKCKLARCQKVFFYNYKYRREFCCPEHRYEYHFPKKPCPGEVLCEGCGIPFKPERPNQKYHSRRCGINHRMRVKYYPQKIGKLSKKEMLMQNSTKCAIEDKLFDLGLTAAEVREMTGTK